MDIDKFNAVTPSSYVDKLFYEFIFKPEELLELSKELFVEDFYIKLPLKHYSNIAGSFEECIKKADIPDYLRACFFINIARFKTLESFKLNKKKHLREIEILRGEAANDYEKALELVEQETQKNTTNIEVAKKIKVKYLLGKLSKIYCEYIQAPYDKYKYNLEEFMANSATKSAINDYMMFIEQINNITGNCITAINNKLCMDFISRCGNVDKTLYDEFLKLYEANKQIPLIALNYIYTALAFSLNAGANKRNIIEWLENEFSHAIRNNRLSIFKESNLDMIYIIRKFIDINKLSSDEQVVEEILHNDYRINYCESAEITGNLDIEKRIGQHFQVHLLQGKISIERSGNPEKRQEEKNTNVKVGTEV